MQKVQNRTVDIVPDELQAVARPNEGSSSSLAVTVLLALSLLWCVLWFVHSWGYWEDDSFIHLEFARSLASGHGFAFNGNLVYGDTAPLWVFLLVGFHLLIPDWIIAGKILAALGTLFALTGVYAFSRRLTATQLHSRVFSAAMVLLFVLNPYFCYWSFSGMETLAATGLALWAAVAATSYPLSWKRFLLGCALAGVGPLMRPEMVFFSAILALVLFYRRLQTPSPDSSSPEPSPRLSSLAGFASGLALLTGPTIAWAIYALHTFGRIVPNTNAAKRAAPGESVILRLINIYSLGFPIIVFGCLAGLIYLVLRFSTLRQNFKDVRRSTIFSAGTVFVLWTLIATAFYIVDKTHVQTRYVFVSAAGLAVVVFAVLLSLSLRIYRPVVIACLAFAAAISIFSVWPFIRNKNIFVETVRQQSLFFHNQLPPDAPVAGYNIGEIAFFSEHPIVDTGGITRPGAIPYLNDPDGMVKWIHSQGGAYYVTFDQPEPGATLVLSQSIPVMGWTLNPRRYSGTEELRVWKLVPPPPPPTQPAP